MGVAGRKVDVARSYLITRVGDVRMSLHMYVHTCTCACACACVLPNKVVARERHTAMGVEWPLN